MYITDFGLTTYQIISALFIHKAKAYKISFSNQVCAGGRPACAWFLKIDAVRIVGMRVRVCVSTPEAINNQWRDMA